MKSFADLSLSVPVLAGYFTASFSSNFEKLKRTLWWLERIWYLKNIPIVWVYADKRIWRNKNITNSY